MIEELLTIEQYRDLMIDMLKDPYIPTALIQDLKNSSEWWSQRLTPEMKYSRIKSIYCISTIY
jgi:hypothetical protein